MKFLDMADMIAWHIAKDAYVKDNLLREIYKHHVHGVA